MGRVKIDLPEQFSFQTIIPVRITDLNYGNHVGNDTILSILHEARVQYLVHYGFEEMNIGGVGIIMSDAAIEFKNELFYGESIIASVVATDFSKFAFSVFYKLEKKVNETKLIVATAKTGMVCYDYDNRRISRIPGAFIAKLQT